MALGLFIALMPIMGAQMPVAVLVAELLRRLFGLRLSRVAAAAGVWVTNPLTAGPIYWLTFKIGQPFARLVLPQSYHSPVGIDLAEMASDMGALAEIPTTTASNVGVIDRLWLKLSAFFSGDYIVELLLGCLIGGMVVGVPLAMVGYRLTQGLVTRYQKRRAERQSRLQRLRSSMVA